MKSRILYGIIISVTKFLVWTFLVFSLLLPLYLNHKNTPKSVELLSSEGDTTYYDGLDESWVNLYMTFDYPCSGTVNVEFYDENDQFLSAEVASYSTLSDNGNEVAEVYWSDVPGQVSSYLISELTSNPSACIDYLWMYIISIVFMVIAIMTTRLNDATYFYNGKVIYVYVGIRRCMIFENNVLMDDDFVDDIIHSAYLSYIDYDENLIDARISKGRITLQINGRRYNERH